MRPLCRFGAFAVTATFPVWLLTSPEHEQRLIYAVTFGAGLLLYFCADLGWRDAD